VVNGLEIFRDHFRGLEDCYILIGGTACDLWMGSLDLAFRPTTDLDIVLILTGNRDEFIKRFWDFVKQAGYKGYKAGETPKNYYRFEKPATQGFPKKIELCSRDILDLPEDADYTPIPAGEDLSSLSAILFDTPYYDYVCASRIEINGVPTVPAGCLIPLKVFAWLGLTAAKEKGDKVKDEDIAKHRADVFRLLVTLTGDVTFALPDLIREDVQRFLKGHPADSNEWPQIIAEAGLDAATEPNVLLAQLRARFQLEEAQS
jgi:hypothetical protein